ncbi:MAG: substrate-binding domain-containing protein [Bacillota bacterium]
MKQKVLLLALSLLLVTALAACGGEGSANEDGFDTSASINPYNRDTSSGTRDGFMSGIDYSEATTDDSILGERVTISSGNDDVLQSVATDEFGIGYISLASLNDDVKALDFEGVEPSYENVTDDSYQLNRPFNYILRTEYDSDREEELTEAFVTFMFSTDGADIINDEGAVAAKDEGSWDDQKPDICDEDNSDITLKFGGSTSVSAVAEALSTSFSSRCGDVVAEHNHTGSSDGFKRAQGEEKDTSNGVHVGFASRPFKDEEKVNDEDLYGKLASDAIVVVVHPDNPMTDITASDLKKIYSGEVETWSDLIDD